MASAWNVEQTTLGQGGCVSLMRGHRMNEIEAERLCASAKAAYPKDRFRIVPGRWARRGFVET